MAKTYLAMTNELLVELNEPELTSISTAVGIQKQVANCVNRAYFDIVDAVDDWSWLSTSNPQNEYYDITSLFQKLISIGRNTSAFPLQEYWLDIGRISEYDQANAEFKKLF